MLNIIQPKCSMKQLLYHHVDIQIMRSLPRLLDFELQEDLEIFGAVSIKGPKGVGKTTTASRFSKSILDMRDPGRRDENLALAGFRPSSLLEGDVPRLMDEWQDAPELWDAVRATVDGRDDPGQFIMISSAVPDGSRISHDGAGRIRNVGMGTLSLFESGDSAGTVSLQGLFQGDRNPEGVSEVEIEDIARYMVHGGWPETVGKSDAAAKRFMKRYCDDIIGTRMSEVSGVGHDGDKVRAVMRSLSEHVSEPLSKARILEGIPPSERPSRNTLDAYLKALGDMYILQGLEAWAPKLRSSTPVRTASKIHFCDPSIAAHFLSVSSEELLRDIRTFRRLFESLVVHDLRIYAQAIGGDVFHYRDKTGLEADAIVCLDDGGWGAVEVGLGAHDIDVGAENLLKLRDRIDPRTMGEPVFLAVVTGTKYAYTREDGVHVIPITLLGPRSDRFEGRSN